MDAIENFIIKLCLIKHAKKPPKEYVWMYKSFSKKVVNIQKFLRVDEKVLVAVLPVCFTCVVLRSLQLHGRDRGSGGLERGAESDVPIRRFID